MPLAVAPTPLPRPAAVAQELPVEPTNILLVTTDDQSVSDMRHMPYTRRLLGEQGVTFSDAVSSYPLCCPARPSLLTGQLAHNHGVLSNKPLYGGYGALRRQPERHNNTIGTWLDDTHDTMFTGTYLNGYGSGDSRDEVRPGWENWYATIGGRDTYNDYGFRVNENGSLHTYRGHARSSRRRVRTGCGCGPCRRSTVPCGTRCRCCGTSESSTTH